MRDKWVPLIESDVDIQRFMDPRIENWKTRLEASLNNNLEPIKLALYTIPLLVLLYIYISLANEAVLQKSIAQDQAERAAALTQIANNNAELADAERRRANLELRQAQITQTRFISDLAVQELRDNEATLAALLALEVLPDSNGKNEWPYDPIAERALIAALDGQT